MGRPIPMRDGPYLTLAGPAEITMKVRGSTFIGFAAPASDEEAAREILAARERIHFDATHNCSAWRIHDGPHRANDAGEPSGSAGAPILAAIDGVGMEDVVVIVTRYFGGTKLGVGGLVRAYGDAAAEALAAAPARQAVPAVRVRIGYAYEHTSAVMRALERTDAANIEHGFAAGGASAELTCVIPEAHVDGLAAILREQTSGSVAIETVGRAMLHRPIPHA